MSLARLLLTAAPLALLTTPTWADPLSFTIFAGTAFATTINVGAMALSLALSVASSLLMKRKAQKTPMQSRKLNPIDGNAPYQYVYGHLRFGGNRIAREVVGKKYYLGYLMQHRPSAGDFTLQLDGREIPLGGDLYNLAGPGAGGIDPTPETEDEHDLVAGHVRAWIDRGDGPGTPPPAMIAAMPSLEEDVKPRPGCTLLWLEVDYGAQDDADQRWPNAEPSATLTGDWSKVYDMRDPAQDADDSSTWTYSDNAALIALDMLRHEDCMGQPGERIDWESFRRGAEICDEPIPLRAGGTEPRFAAHGVWRADGKTPPIDQIQEVLDASMAELQEVMDGETRKFAYIPGVYREPSITFGPDIFADDDYEIEAMAKPEDVVNCCRLSFLSPVRHWEMTELPAYVDEIGLDEDGGEKIWAEGELLWVTSPGQAARIQKRRVKLARSGKRVRGRFLPDALATSAGDVIRIDAPHDPILGGVYLVEAWGLEFVADDETLGVGHMAVTMTLLEFGPEADAWDAAEEPAISASREITGLLPTGRPSDLEVAPEVVSSGDGSSILAARVSALPPEGATIDYYALRWRAETTPEDFEGWVNGAPIPGDQTDSAGRVSGLASPLRTGVKYQFQMSSVAGKSRSKWAETEQVLTPDTPPPSAPEPRGATADASGIETEWVMPAHPDVRKLRVHRAAAPSFAGSELIAEAFATPGAVLALPDPDAPDSVVSYYWAVAVDKWGKASTPSDPQSATRPL